MTIWINNPFDFLPGEGARLQRYGLLAQALAQAGHRVIWWSSDWDHFKKEERTPRQGEAVPEQTPRQGEAVPGPEIRLIKTMPYYQNVGVRRLVSHWLYAKRWERMALRCDPADRPDLIICSAPPLSTGWVMRGLCKHFECRGVVDVMDLWPETFERVAPAWMLWPLRWMAKRVYQGADAISAVGDSYLEAVKKQYQSAVAVGSGEERGKKKEETPRQGEAVPRRTPRQGEAVPGEKPMYRCYHGIEKVAVGSTSRQLGQGGAKVAVGSSSRQLEEGMPTADCQPPTANLKLVYVGNMGRGYDLGTLVGAVAELSEEGVSISLDLAGSGEQEAALQKLAHATQSIAFHGVVTGDALCALLQQADLGVVPMFPNTHVAVPYKLADYVAAGVPVVNSLAGETALLLEQYACGWQYEAGSLASLKQVLKEVCELKQSEAGAFEARGRNAKRLAEECFDAARIYPAFVRWLLLLPLSGSKGVVKR
jgi:glycosyltransferase involved in cell wall biosynthesis